MAALPMTIMAWPAIGLAATDEAAAQRQLDAIGKEIQAASQRLADTGDARDSAGRELREVETALAEIHQRLDALQAERGQLEDETTRLTAHRQRLEAERHAQYAALSAQLEALYRLGPTPQLKLLLNQDDPAELDRMQAYLNRLTQARNKRLADIAQLDDALAQTARELAQRRQRLDEVTVELEGEGARLAKRMDERRQLLAKLDQRYTTEEARLESLNQDRVHAERTLREVQAELAKLAQPTPSTQILRTQGELPWPVQGNITAAFRRSDGVHANGIVIQAAAGTPVTAVHSGRVVFADWMRGFGNLLIIDHGDQIMTLHAHLQRFSARPGQAIERGDELGRVGDSGGQTNAALYFEVRRGGEPINPQRWIAGR
ncbi:peptidoglycan DD-metalloendopeptidase family protein [Halomonas sp. Bachu 37]|uniref:murein hydrolase activator EnvC family protein n=1 Tax=Halomonas kashgarensis TaxID=3084920 RepID=UPI003216F381